MGKCFSCMKSSSSNSENVQTKQAMALQGPNGIECAYRNNQEKTVSVVYHNTSDNTSPSVSSHKDKHFRAFYPRISCVALTSDVKLKKSLSESKINTLFDVYKDPIERDLMLAEGIERFCSDLELSPDDFKILVLAWKLNAQQMCQFTRQEFVTGCKSLKVGSLRSIQSKLSEFILTLRTDSQQFKNLYRFTYNFGLDNLLGQRILPIEMAICLWKVVFTIREPDILYRWLEFLESRTNIRGIPRDTWNMFLNFSEFIGDDLSTYDDTEAWPTIFDDFVEYENDKINQNVIKKERVASIDDI